jgi:hypothetical protein
MLRCYAALKRGYCPKVARVAVKEIQNMPLPAREMAFEKSSKKGKNTLFPFIFSLY